MNARLPDNEELRLTALHGLGVLDTPPEERFDRITRVAARVFNAPITLVSLVDANRQWFKSCVGLTTQETPRSMSFCAHALDAQEALVIPDAEADGRFRENPMVVGEPHIRFYAGHPLRTHGGLAMGTLCIIDRVPRTFGAAERELLKDLASWAEDELNVLDTARDRARWAETEARLTAIYDNVAEAVLVIIGGVVQGGNAAARRLFTSADLVGLAAADLLPGWSPEDLRLEAAENRQHEGMARRRDGSEFDAWVSLAGIRLGRTPATVAIVRDVTDPQRALAQLHTSLDQQREMYQRAEIARSETRAILAATSEGIAVVSAGRAITAADREFAGVFGVQPEDLVDRDVAVLEELASRAFARPDPFLRLLSLDPSAGRRRTVLHQAWPQERDLEVLTAPVDASGGRPVGRIYLLRDVTAETELERVKSDFVSTVAHELRTPLTAIMGFSDLILAGAAQDSRSVSEDIRVIRDNAVRLNELVDDLLDVSRVESGTIRMDMEPVRLDDVVRNVVRTLAPRFASKGQPLRLDIPGDLPAVNGDRKRLEQVAANLLSNAHKYTLPGGDITVAASATESTVTLAVTDTGVGLSVDEQSRLFGKFFRARNAATRDIGGTGLGLVISRSLVRQHGGDIEVVSRPGQGSTFTVVLPRPQPAA